MEKKLYLVETVSMFRMRYVIEANEESHAHDEFIMEVGKDSFKEFSQHHIDEVIVSSRKLSASDYIELFDKDNDYCKLWPVSKKMEVINTIDYKK